MSLTTSYVRTAGRAREASSSRPATAVQQIRSIHAEYDTEIGQLSNEKIRLKSVEKDNIEKSWALLGAISTRRNIIAPFRTKMRDTISGTIEVLDEMVKSLDQARMRDQVAWEKEQDKITFGMPESLRPGERKWTY
jgi:hypothetical protein